MGAFYFDFEDEGVGVVSICYNYGTVDTVGWVAIEAEVAGDEAFMEEGVEQFWHLIYANNVKRLFCVGAFDTGRTFMLFIFFKPEYQTSMTLIITHFITYRLDSSRSGSVTASSE